MRFNRETINETVKSGGNGMTKLAGGLITTPVQYIDLPLAVGYNSFAAEFCNFQFSVVSDPLCFGLSSDGGSTFHNGLSDYTITTQMGSGGPVSASSLTDTLGYFSGAAGIPLICSLTIFPGDAATFPLSSGNFSAFNTGLGVPFIGIVSAVLTSEMLRQNVLRVLPYGNGDINPPTSGETIDAGSYILWGIN